MSRVLVHFHLFYHDQIDFFVEKLSNINSCEWDLVVTYLEENQESFEKLKSLKPDVKLVQVENRGYDVWPFINVIKSTNLDEYDYVLKIHTKRALIGPQKEPDYWWRNNLISALLDDKFQFKQNLIRLKFRKKIGMICTLKHKMDCCIDPSPEASEMLDDELSRIHLIGKKREFCAGTMFIARANIFKFLQSEEITEEDFSCDTISGNCGTLAHVYERLLCIAVTELGYKIHFINTYKIRIENFIKSIFSIKNHPDKKHKVITILGLKFKFKSKKIQKKLELQKENYINNLVEEISNQSNNNFIIYFDHSLGGGTETYFFNQLNELSNNSILLRIQFMLSTKQYKITVYNNNEQQEVDNINFILLSKIIKNLQLNKIILNNIVAYPSVKSILDLISNYKKCNSFVEVIVKGHDFYSICPEWNLLNSENKFCNVECSEQECLKCFDKIKLKFSDIQKNLSISSWRTIWKDFLTNTVDILEVFSPSSKEIFLKAYPEIKEKIILNPHRIKPFPKSYIGILGHLSIHKGSEVISKLLKYLESNSIFDYHFILIGDNPTNIKSDLLTVLGKYDRNNLPNILKNNNIDLVFIPSICSETYSYTTAEAIALDYPVACFDIGGQADQVKQYSKGKILSSFESEIIEKELRDFLENEGIK